MTRWRDKVGGGEGGGWNAVNDWQVRRQKGDEENRRVKKLNSGGETSNLLLDWCISGANWSCSRTHARTYAHVYTYTEAGPWGSRISTLSPGRIFPLSQLCWVCFPVCDARENHAGTCAGARVHEHTHTHTHIVYHEVLLSFSYLFLLNKKCLSRSVGLDSSPLWCHKGKPLALKFVATPAVRRWPEGIFFWSNCQTRERSIGFKRKPFKKVKKKKNYVKMKISCI